MSQCAGSVFIRWHAYRACAGFTLIELLIALTLVGLLSVLLVGGLRFGARVWETGHEHSESFAEIEAVHGFLRRQLSQARLSVQAAKSPAAPADFIGSGDRLRFMGTLSAYVGVGGLYRFELAPVERTEGMALELAWQLYRPDRREWFEDDPSRRILIEGIEEVRFRYFGSLDVQDVAEWRNSWASKTSLPALVSLEIEFSLDDPRNWPTLTTPLHISDLRSP
jgi:general secretion pathway protein J